MSTSSSLAFINVCFVYSRFYDSRKPYLQGYLKQPSWWRTSWITQLYVNAKGTRSFRSCCVEIRRYRWPCTKRNIGCLLCTVQSIVIDYVTHQSWVTVSFLHEFLYLVAAQNLQNWQKILLAIKSRYTVHIYIYSRASVIQTFIIRTLGYPNTIMNVEIPQDSSIFCTTK